MIQKLILFLSFFSVIPDSPAFDLEVIRNDKEAVSQYLLVHPAPSLPSPPRLLLEASFGEFSRALDATLATNISGRFPTELELMNRFRQNLEKAGLSISREYLKLYFFEWRKLDWIDDLLLEILEHTAALIETFDQPVPALSRWTRSSSARYVLRSGLTPIGLRNLLAPIKGLTPGAPGPVLERWAGLVAGLPSDAILPLLNHAYVTGLLSPEEFRLADALRLHRVEGWNLRLGPYLRMVREVKNSRRPNPPGRDDLAPNTFSSSTLFRNSPLTRRAALYTRFTPLQVNLQVSLLRRFFLRMDAKNLALVFSSETGSESVPLSPMAQYHFARKLLLRDLQELNRSVLFQNTPVSFEDLITASLETGLIHGGILNEVNRIDDLWNPVIAPWTKLTGFALRVSGNAVVFLPPPYNILSSVALILIESRVEKRNHRKPEGGPGYDPF